jgi:hypothetical protein
MDMADGSINTQQKYICDVYNLVRVIFTILDYIWINNNKK